MPHYDFTPHFRTPPPASPGPVAADAVALVQVNRGNVRMVCDLRVGEAQRHLVGPAAYTVAEGLFEPGSILRAITADGVVVGILLVEFGLATPYLVRFLIDQEHQGRGIGRIAVTQLCDLVAASGQYELEVTFVPEAGGARGFWEACGFEDTGRIKDGEPVYRQVFTSDVPENDEGPARARP